MVELPGYHTAELIGKNTVTAYYRLVHRETGKSVMCITTRDEYPGTEAGIAYRREFEVLQILDGHGAVEPIDLEFVGNRPMLLVEYFGGQLLSGLLTPAMTLGKPVRPVRELGITTLLRIATGIATSLKLIHCKQIVHNAVCPSHILINTDTMEVRLTGFQTCFVMNEHNRRFAPAGWLKDVLPYISPEQTGRLNHGQNHRTDFYSLGAALYELFTGQQPFAAAADELELIHSHIAGNPTAVSIVEPLIPWMLSDIVRKCMHKTPEDRYNSAFGIEADFRTCLEQMLQTGVISSFVPAYRDAPRELYIPKKMYGRELEEHRLLAIKNEVARNASQFVLVSGPTGMGKTTFVQESLRAHSSTGLFISGKFDPYQSDIPYSAWIQAIEDLIRQLLTGSNRQMEFWKLRIQQEIGEYTGLLLDLIPQLELLIGPQPDIHPIPSPGAHTRLQFVLHSFIHVFANAGQPLIVFIDDLQWADEASLQLLVHLMHNGQSRHLLLIGSCREDELYSGHPLRQMEAMWDSRNAAIAHIHLAPLTEADLLLLLTDALRFAEGDFKELAALLAQKTSGLPLFIQPFLQHAFAGNLITFLDQTGSWHWDLAQISALEAPKLAIGYALGKPKSMPSSAIELLIWAAFLGQSFEPASLSLVTGRTMTEVLTALQSGVAEGLLEIESPVEGELLSYAFRHDRIRQDLYLLVPEAKLADYHWKIGKMLSERLLDYPVKETQLFEAVNHLNLGFDSNEHADEKLELAELNYRAGRKAKQATAYEAALRYYRLAASLLQDNGWETCFELTFQVFKEQAECEFLCNHTRTALELFDMVLSRALTDLDKVHIYIIMIQLELNRQNNERLHLLCKRALQLCGIRQASQQNSFTVARQWLRVMWKLRGGGVDTMRKLPPMSDPHRLAAMSILVSMSHASFVLNKQEWVATMLTIMELTLDYGMAPESSIGFVGMALIHTLKNRQYHESYKWGKLSMEVSAAYPKFRAITSVSFSICYDSWRRYEPELIEEFIQDAEKTRLESGNVWYANQNIMIISGISLLFSKPLDEAYRRLIKGIDHISGKQNWVQLKYSAVLASLFAKLAGETQLDNPFAGIDIRDEAFPMGDNGQHDANLQEGQCLYIYLISYMFGQFKEAYEYSAKAELLYEARDKSVQECSAHSIYYFLSMAALYPTSTRTEQKKYMKTMRRLRLAMKRYASICPENYRHKYLLMSAEYARIKQQYPLAGKLYEQACDDAFKNGFTHNRAVTAECAVRFYMSRNQLHMAAAYVTQAHQDYLQWGAKAKAADLAARYRHLLITDSASLAHGIDYQSVMRSAQTISGEMVMSRLLDKLMRIMLQNAGAEKGALIFDNEGILEIEAYGTSGDVVLERIPLEQTNEVATAIVAYTARTLKEIVLQDAAAEGIFTQIPYVQQQKLKSVMCLPIMKNAQLICILYLENNLSAGVFTPERIDVLKLLCSQCAISIDNARLYANIERLNDSLEEQVRERTSTLERSMRETAEALAEVSIQSERNRIAAEVHDIVGHTLTSTILQIEAGKRQLLKDKEGALRSMQGAQDLIRHGLSETRRSVHMLKEGAAFDLTRALHKLIRDTEQHTGITVKTDIVPLPRLSAAHNHVIYHALQEGLTNGIRHGSANSFHLVLNYDGKFLFFRLEDYGSGAVQYTQGFGLTAMRQRVEELDGQLHIDLTPGRGGLLRIVLPYRIPQEVSMLE
ncbi:MAG: histidine kinase [Paenibacillus sp.]|nr:histidine kinase [Paenibacillus sp.]